MSAHLRGRCGVDFILRVSSAAIADGLWAALDACFPDATVTASGGVLFDGDQEVPAWVVATPAVLHIRYARPLSLPCVRALLRAVADTRDRFPAASPATLTITRDERQQLVTLEGPEAEVLARLRATFPCE